MDWTDGIECAASGWQDVKAVDRPTIQLKLVDKVKKGSQLTD